MWKEKKKPCFAGKEAKTIGRREHEKSNVDVAKNGQFISFLYQTISSFREGNLSIRVVFYTLYLQFHSTHCLSLIRAMQPTNSISCFLGMQKSDNWRQKVRIYAQCMDERKERSMKEGEVRYKIEFWLEMYGRDWRVLFFERIKNHLIYILPRKIHIGCMKSNYVLIPPTPGIQNNAQNSEITLRFLISAYKISVFSGFIYIVCLMIIPFIIPLPFSFG